jgi:hypothetical protein
VFRRHLLNPIRYGLFAWKLFSHKVCRWLVPLLLVPGAAGLALLAGTYTWALVALAAGLAGGAAAIVGALWPTGRSMPRPLSMLTFAAAANLAAVHAVLRAVRGGEGRLWEPTRRH